MQCSIPRKLQNSPTRGMKNDLPIQMLDNAAAAAAAAAAVCMYLNIKISKS